jgi:tetratricopeptide (TPR) repeat protein
LNKNTSNKDLEKLNTLIFQEALDKSLLSHNIIEAQKLLERMEAKNPDDYWLAAELGYAYNLAGDSQKSEMAFKKCLELFKQSHPECSHGLERVQAGKPDDLRYLEISQIIKGEKSWQSF